MVTDQIANAASRTRTRALSQKAFRDNAGSGATYSSQIMKTGRSRHPPATMASAMRRNVSAWGASAGSRFSGQRNRTKRMAAPASKTETRQNTLKWTTTVTEKTSGMGRRMNGHFSGVKTRFMTLEKKK